MRAADGAGCAMGWTSNLPASPEACTFRFNGTPIQIYGEASATSASASTEIRVWVSPAGSPEIPLLECTARGNGFSSCGAERTPIVVDARFWQLPGSVAATLQCNVSWRGNGPGEAGCFNPEPCPTLGDPRCLAVLGEPLEVPR